MVHVVADSFIFYKEVIPPKLIDLILEEIEDLESVEDPEEARVGGSDTNVGFKDLKIRNSKIRWWYETHWVSSLFSHYIGVANSQCWQYDLNILQSIQVTSYGKEGHYHWHCDYGTSQYSDYTRKLSASLLVTDPADYDGGDLEIMDYSGNIIKAPKERGSIIIFDSRTPHRVTPLSRGNRTSLVTWMYGPKLK